MGGCRSLPHLVAVMLGVLVTGLATACEAAPHPAPAASAAPTAAATAKPDTVIAVGVPSIVELPRTLFGPERPVCIDFLVQAVGAPVPRVRMATSGVAGARLLEPRGTGGTCDRGAAAASATLLLQDLRDTPRELRLLIEPRAFPSVSAAKGQVLMIREGLPPIEVPLTLQREDFSPAFKAAQWFFGVLVPALLTAGGGVLVYRIQKSHDLRKSERDVFDRFKRDKGFELGKLFKGAYTVAARSADPERFIGNVERVLQESGVFDALPVTSKHDLIGAVKRGDRAGVAARLAELFPEHKDAVLAAQQGKG